MHISKVVLDNIQCMTRPILKRRKTPEQKQAERRSAFNKANWQLLERVDKRHWLIRHKTCGSTKHYAIASLINTGLKPRCEACLNIARVKALANVGYALGERVDGAKFNITHLQCGNSFSYKVSSVVALGTTPVCPHCAALKNNSQETTS